MGKGFKDAFSSFCLLLTLVVVVTSPDLLTYLNLPSLGDGDLDTLASAVVAAAVSYMLGLSIAKIIPFGWKDKFLFLSDGFPSTHIFSDLRNGRKLDSRIQLELAQGKYQQVIDDIPSDESERAGYEDREWYRLCTKYRSDTGISELYSEYLYLRDVCMLAFSAMVLCGVLDVVAGLAGVPQPFTLLTLVALLVLGVFHYLGARDEASLLVIGVLLVDLYSEE